MRTELFKFKHFIVAILCLLAIFLLPKLVSAPVDAIGLSIGFLAMRSGILALFFIVLGIVLLRSTIAKRSFQTVLLPDKDYFTAKPLLGTRISQYFLQPSILVFTVSFLSLIAFCYVAFTLNDSYLLWQMDGKRFEYLVRQQSVWFPFYSGYTNDFFHSLGNIWYPLNMKLDPGFFLATDPSNGALDKRLSYLIFSVELYLSTFLLSTVLRQNAVISALAGWLVVLLAMPVHRLPALYPILAMAPNYPISQTVLILCLFRLIGRTSDGSSVALSAVIAFLLAHTALAHPTAVILMAPILLIFSTCIVLASDSRRELIAKLVGAAAGSGILTILGFPRYLIGIFEYTAPYYFSSELFNDRAFYYFVSLVFQNGVPGIALFFLALIGAALIARFGGKLERIFAIGLLSAVAVLTGVGALTASYFESWRGPSPIYFEFFLWPIYAIFGAVTFRALYYAGSVFVSRAVKAGLMVKLNRIHMFYLLAALLCVPWALLVYLNPHFTRTHSPFGFSETRLVSALKEEVGLQPGSLFRGRVATLTGQNIHKPVNWHDLNALDNEIFLRSGNSHQSIGLWSYGIPTLFELSSLITPPFFLIAREFLERPGDLQMRNTIALRNYNPRVLRALGVRFVITDAPIDGNARLWLRQEMPTSATHYLYELDGANRGDYSPTGVEVIADVSKTIAALGDPAFDFTSTVVLETALQDKLVPAKSSKVYAEPGYLRLRASSEGTSLLVLPFEFSNCLMLESTGGNVGGSRIVRANLLQAGILFTRHLDATLTFFTGPLRNAGCRIQDKRDMDKLNIRQFHKEIAMPPSRFPGLQ